MKGIVFSATLHHAAVFCELVAMHACFLAGGLRTTQAAEVGEPRFLRREFQFDQSPVRGYLLFLPRNFSQKDRRPVLMFLNGAGENGVDGFLHISKNFGMDVWRMRDVLPFVVVAPQYDDDWRIFNALDDVEREYGTDPDRVYLTGVSGGGSAVWSEALSHPQRFAAIAPLCGHGADGTDVLVTAKLPIWNLYNSGDDAQLVALNRATREELIQLGASPLATEYHDIGHNCWTRGYATEVLYAWFLKHDRKKNLADVANFAVVEPATVLAEWDRRGTATWRVEDDPVILICSAPAAGDQGVVIGSAMTDDWEMHFDARTDGPAFRIGLFGENETEHSTLVLMIPYAESGIGGLSTLGAAGELRMTAKGPLTPEHLLPLTPVQTPVEGEGGSTAEGEGRTPGTEHDRRGAVSAGERLIARLDPVGQRQLDPKGWNDLRITKRGNALSLTINGWPALECRDAAIDSARRFGLLAPATGTEGEVRWRYLRWRPLGEKVDEAETPSSTSAPSNATSPAPRQPPQRLDRTEGSTRDSETGRPIDLDAIVAAWRWREAAFPRAEITWRVRQDDLSRFGSYPPLSEGTAGDAVPSERLLIDGERWRFDGRRSVPVAASIPHGKLAGGVEFRALLAAKRLPEYTPTETVVDFTAWHAEGAVTRVWGGSRNEPSRSTAEKLARSETVTRGFRKRGGVRLQDLLLEGALLSLRPFSSGPLADADHDCRLIERPRPVEGEEWTVLEQPIRSAGESKPIGVREYWLDAERGFAIVRVIDRWDPFVPAQLDLHYAGGEADDALPTAWIALTMDANHDATSFAWAESVSVTGDPPQTEERLAVRLPEGTRLVSQRQNAEAVATGDRSVRHPGAASSVGVRSRLARLVAAARTPVVVVIVLGCVAAAGRSMLRAARPPSVSKESARRN